MFPMECSLIPFRLTDYVKFTLHILRIMQFISYKNSCESAKNDKVLTLSMKELEKQLKDIYLLNLVYLFR